MAKQRGGVNTSTPAPTLHLNSISAGDTTLSISADEPITRAVADDAALLAGITVHYAPFEGTRGTDNIATAATITNNAIIITISRTAAEGDEFFVQLAAGLVQNTAGTANTTLTGDEALYIQAPKTTPPQLTLDTVSTQDTTLYITADYSITRAVADDAALLAGVTVHYTPFEGTRGTDNIATAATITNNAIVITISQTTAEGDEFFVQLAAGLVQDSFGNTNIALTSDEELTYKIAVSPFIVVDLPRSTGDQMSDNYRSYHITFSIRTGTAEAGEYTLGLKPVASSAPSVSELRSATAVISRVLSSTVINLYLPFHMEGTYFNTGATRNFDTALATLLSPETTYTLYATKKDGTGPMLTVSDFTTDVLPTTAPTKYGAPSNSYTYTISDEVQPFLFIVIYAESNTFYVQLVPTSDFVQCEDPPTCLVNPALNYNGLANGFISSDSKTFIISTDENTIARQTENAFNPEDGFLPIIPISFTVQASP